MLYVQCMSLHIVNQLVNLSSLATVRLCSSRGTWVWLSYADTAPLRCLYWWPTACTLDWKEEISSLMLLSSPLSLSTETIIEMTLYNTVWFSMATCFHGYSFPWLSYLYIHVLYECSPVVVKNSPVDSSTAHSLSSLLIASRLVVVYTEGDHSVVIIIGWFISSLLFSCCQFHFFYMTLIGVNNNTCQWLSW